jgi:Leucine-rich repeat (LRR) protein
VREEWVEGKSSKIIGHLKMANPWALDRQFTSWSKRITDAALDPDKINVMKGFITKQLDAARRVMITSDEFAPFWARKYQPTNVLVAAGAKHLEIKIEDLASIGIPGTVVDSIAAVIAPKDPKITTVHVLDFGSTPRLPPFLPAELKDTPWIVMHGGHVTGMGLSGSRMKEIPRGILDLPDLKILDLSNNAIKHVDALGVWPNLRHLDLSRNLLTSFQPTGTGLTVRFLDLHCNSLKEVDVAFAASGLRVLDLSRNQIAKMVHVKGVGVCQKLGTVNLAWNKLDSLQDFAAMNRLVMLFLNGNGLVKLGNDMVLPSVRRLDLSDNNLGALKGMGNFPAVFHVNARKNYLKNTKEIDTMPHLREFLASSNQIESTGELTRLKKLGLLDLRGNPLSELEKDEEKVKYLFAPVRFAT